MEENLLNNFHRSSAKKIFSRKDAKGQRRTENLFMMKLKKKVEEKVADPAQKTDLVALLSSAPTYSKKQLDEIATTRKAINQWRTK